MPVPKLSPLAAKLFSHLQTLLHRNRIVVHILDDIRKYLGRQPPKARNAPTDSAGPPIASLARYQARAHDAPVRID